MYKYCAFNHHSLTNLRNLELWCNHYEAFNDPFECWCIERKGIPDPDKEWDRFDHVARTWGFTSGHDVSKEDLFNYCSEFIHPYSMRVNHYLESARISCFSRRPDNLLMWSHYADGFRGFCIEFDKDLLLENPSKYAEVHEVFYSKLPPVVDTIVYEVAKDQVWYHEMAIEETETSKKYIKEFKGDSFLPDYRKALLDAQDLLYVLYRSMLCHKPINWEYEEETRLILHTESDGKDGEPYSYSKDAIKAVIIGEKISNDNVDKINNILTHLGLNVPIKQAVRSRNKYEVLIQ
jgi:hypothetical protein